MKRPPTLAATLTATLLAAAAAAQPHTPCGSFESVPTPGQNQPGHVLSAVGANGSAAFAVGRAYSSSGPIVPLVYRYHSAGWAAEAMPQLPAGAFNPILMSTAMSPATGDDAWVAGYVSMPPIINNLPLIMRWSGSGWASVQTPSLRPMTVYPYSPRGGLGYDVAVLAHDNVWVVGVASGFGDAQASTIAMALHFDGSSWTDTVVPVVGNRRNSFEAVSASAPDNVWAAGFWNHVGGPFRGLVCRFDGSSWSVVDNPGMDIAQAQFTDVLALSPTEVWISGAINYTTPLLYRWNGSSWQEMPQPAPGSGIIALAGTGPTDIWAATSGAVVSIFHWNGAGWAEAANPPPPPGLIDSVRGLAVAGDCDVWAVGSQMNSTGFLGTFAEHLTAGGTPCPADWNGDNAINSADISGYLTSWLDSVQNGNLVADFNVDGAVNSSDISAFITAWLTAVLEGC